MRLPDFVVVGAQKCGTTALHRYLSAHPNVFVPDYKELNFFRDDGNWGRGVTWYGSHFAHAGPDQVLGEASPQYAMLPDSREVAPRMADLLPDARLVYLVRHPFERMRSAWQQQRARGRESRPLGVALVQERRYVDHTRYGAQVEAFAHHYPRDRILVLQAESLRDDRRRTLRRVFDFLAVEGDVPDEAGLPPAVHASSAKSRPSDLALRVAGSRVGAGVKRVMPLGLKRAAISWGAVPLASDAADIPDAVRRALLPGLRDDVARLAPFMDDDFDGWGLL